MFYFGGRDRGGCIVEVVVVFDFVFEEGIRVVDFFILDNGDFLVSEDLVI